VDAVDLTHADAEAVRALAAGSGRVVMTMPGLFGDSALDAFPALSDAPSWRAQVERSEADYRVAITSREMLRVSRRLAITRASGGLGASFALDARTMRPPYVPIGRGEDSLFVRMLLRSDENAFVGYLPLAVLHAPQRGVYTFDAIPRRKWLVEVLLDVACGAELHPPGMATPERSLALLGAHLVDLAGADPDALADYLQQLGMQSARACVHAAESILRAKSGRPEWWARDVHEQLEKYLEWLESRGAAPPDDLVGVAEGEGWQLVRRHLEAFGRLLLSWPAIFRAAAALRESEEPFFVSP
jgi:hypothetical protein